METASSNVQKQTAPFEAGVAALNAGDAQGAAPLLLAAVRDRPADMLRCNYLLYALYLAAQDSYDEYRPVVAAMLENPLLLNIGLLVRVWVRMAQAVDVDNASWDTLAEPFFCAGLRLSVIPDVMLEGALTRLRARLLAAALAGKVGTPAMVTVAEALAQCCFNNEYVFAQGAEETAAVAQLAARQNLSPLGVAMVAAYEPLGRHERILRMMKGILPSKTRKALPRLYTQQVEEPAEEARLRGSLPAIGRIADGVSRAVQAQYEENPYPRWVSLGGVFNDDAELPLPRLMANPKPAILIAGCATGRYPIGVAVTRRAATVAGLDLSRTSLAYAARMARLHGVGNLSFIHGDILDVGALGRTFDAIETVGVLHHMRAPERGLAALCGVLEPGGYIKLGLYSRTARRHIIACQRDLKERGLPPTADGIRAAREWIKGLSADHPYRTMMQYDDYYSTSMVRDMLFHVQEHVYDIAGVRALVDGAGLRLMGFVNLPPPVASAFAAMFPDPAARTAWDSWAAFEEAHPDSFIGMYRFWCEKRTE